MQTDPNTLTDWVVYYPPKSNSFGHGSRIRDSKLAWETAKRFLQELTDASAPEKIRLSCRSESQWLTKERAELRRAEVEAAFGKPSEEYPTDAHWDLQQIDLEKAVAFELSGPKSQKDSLDPSSLRLDYAFRWRRPSVGPEAMSQFAVNIRGAKTFFQMHFVFPWPIESSEFRSQLTSVEHAVPFKLNDAYFKRWVINSKRTDRRLLKAEVGWRAAWLEH